jgi:hypothetical protein
MQLACQSNQASTIEQLANFAAHGLRTAEFVIAQSLRAEAVS